MDSYAKQVGEIENWGDVTEVYKYQKRAQTLENRLIAGMEKIDKFNEEEAAFGWEITQYPRRKQIADQLKPFKQLFDAICDFMTKHDLWLNSMIGGYSPEEIDNDVGHAYRLISSGMLSSPSILTLEGIYSCSLIISVSIYICG